MFYKVIILTFCLLILSLQICILYEPLTCTQQTYTQMKLTEHEKDGVLALRYSIMLSGPDYMDVRMRYGYDVAEWWKKDCETNGYVPLKEANKD